MQSPQLTVRLAHDDNLCTGCRPAKVNGVNRIDIASISLRNAQQQMEFPFFSLSKSRDLEIRRNEDLYGNTLEIYPHGMGLPTICGKKLLICAIFQVMERLNRGDPVCAASFFMPATCWKLPTKRMAARTTKQLRMRC